jgi:Leucine-rich repeat (LRR) protein
MPNLKELHLEGDRFNKLPEQIKELKNLEALYLRDNNLTDLPESLIYLKRLKYVDLTNNRIPHILLDRYRETFDSTVRITF